MAPRVLIAGAGIGGLTAAVALARRGVGSSVFEREAVLQAAGAGVQLSPNASRVLDALGLGPALDAVAVRPEAVTIAEARKGRTLAELPLGRSAESRWGAPYRTVHRADLQNVLLEAAVAAPEITLTLGAAAAEAEDAAEGARLMLSNGAAHDGDLLIGADGLRSAVRRAVKLPTEPRATGLTALRAVVPAEALPPAFRGPRVSAWLSAGQHMVVYPVRRGQQANVVLIGPLGAASAEERVADWAEPARRLVAAATAWTDWPLFDRAPDARMRRGRIALIGDASHAALPSLAQGAAFAIEDAAVLARLIGDGNRDPLGQYERTRLMRVMRLAPASRRQIAIDHMGGLAAHARNLALSAAPTGALLGGLDWIYGWKDAA